MGKVHKLVAAIATSITLSATSAYALNMGEVSWKSSYGQSLNARVELTDIDGLTATEITPSLASQDQFAKFGLERTPELSNLTFKTVIGANGKGYIQIGSTKPISEPFLNFLLNINWKGNSISREYTILMDLPSAGGVPSSSLNSYKNTDERKSSAATRSTVTSDTYVIERGDTLWSIAEKLTNKSIAAKTATAIYKKNPKAFINSSANHLVAGYKITVPTEQEINVISASEATSFLQSTKSATVAASTAAKSNDKTIDNNSTKLLENKLQASEQELDNARRENDKLSTQLEQLQSEINRLEELSKQKDSQIKQAEKLVTNEVDREAHDLVKQAEADKANADAAAQTEESQLEAEQKTKEAAEKAEADRLAAEKAEAEADKNTTTQPVVNQPETKEESFLSSLLKNQQLLIAGGAALVALCLAGLLLARRKKAANEATVVDLSHMMLNDDNLKSDDDLKEEDTSTISSAEPQSASPLSQLGEGMGVIDKADIYLAYNHYDEAKDLLTSALQEDPTSTEYRLKLMEVYGEQGDIKNFEAEEQELSLLDPLAQPKIDALKEKYSHATNTIQETSFDNIPSLVEETPVRSEFSFDSSSKEKHEIINTPNSHPDIDQSFELEKIASHPDELEKPIFNANIDEHDGLSADSLVYDFITDKEIQSEEPKAEAFKFDLGLDDEQPSAIQETTFDHIQSTAQEHVEDISDSLEKDQIATKLELVHAYIDMGDTEGAHDLLNEIIKEGNETQQVEAKSLLASLGEQPTSFQAAIPEKSDIQLETSEPAITQDPVVDIVASEDLGFELSPEDEVSTKLELAAAYIEMGDNSGAKDILEEVLSEGTEEQKNQAQDLLHSIK